MRVSQNNSWSFSALFAGCFVFLAAMLLAAPSALAGERYVVVLKNGVSPHGKAASIGATPGNIYSHAVNGFSAALSPGQVRKLKADVSVKYVAVDRVVTASATAKAGKPKPGGGGSAPPQEVPTGVKRIGGLSNSVASIDGIDTRVGVDVAVIDTGIDSSHPDLNVAGGFNCSSGRGWKDGNGHGTHVAGTIGAIDNGTGVVGVSPGARLWAVRVLNNAGSGSTASVTCGLDWVVANAASIEVANLSLGGAGTDDGNCGATNNDPMHEAVCAAVDAGVTIVVAAGNESADSSTSTPAAYDEVITVSALADFNGAPGGGAASTCRADVDDSFADFSNFGSDVDIAAPGVCIKSTWLSGGFNTISGTSMASPHVTGAVALYKAAFPGATPADAKAALVASAEAGPIAGDPDAFAEGVLRVS